MRFAVTGPMLVVDASCLYEVLVDAPYAEMVRRRLAADDDQAAPHLIDAEVVRVVRAHHRRGLLDPTAANQALEDLRDWPGERYGHRMLLERAWELKDTVRGWDALYVAMAEALDATLITLDGRLASASGPRCVVDLVRLGPGRDAPAQPPSSTIEHRMTSTRSLYKP
jgi:predicted nucleic acid-binding protein